MERKWKIRLVLLLWLLGTLGIIAIIPYEITNLMSNEFYITNPGAMSIPLVITINTIFQIIFLFLLVLIGVRLQKRTILGAPKLESVVYGGKLQPFSQKWLLISVFITLILSLIVLLLDLFIFSSFIETSHEQTTTTVWWQGLLTVFYGGITEELMVRLFGMTLIVWLLARITKREKEDIPHTFYYIAIFSTAILFGLGHLPATVEIFGELNSMLVIRALTLNGLLGLWFGYLYWKKGLEYAIVAHMSADFLVHVVFMQIV